MEEILGNAVVQMGAVGLLVAYLMRRDGRRDEMDAAREMRMTKRINELEDFQVTKLATVVENSITESVKTRGVLAALTKQVHDVTRSTVHTIVKEIKTHDAKVDDRINKARDSGPVRLKQRKG